MANPEDDIPPALAHIAYRVPEAVRAECSATELRIRCEAILDLIAKADMASEESRARNLRRRAERMTKAMSPAAYAADHARLDAELAQANRGGETHRAMAALEELHWLERHHPQPPAEMYRNALQGALIREVEKIEKRLPPIPPPVQSRVFRRKRRN
jgi:hypothetical protein